jgi:hypothetical protein
MTLTRALAFIVLTVLQAFIVIVSPLAPILLLGPVYICELGLDRLRPEYIDPRTDLREYFKRSGSSWPSPV